MDRPEEAAGSVNPREQGLSASEPSESNLPNEPTEALLRISQDMARVLDRLTSPKAPIDTVKDMEQRNSMGQAWKSQRKPNSG